MLPLEINQLIQHVMKDDSDDVMCPAQGLSSCATYDYTPMSKRSRPPRKDYRLHPESRDCQPGTHGARPGNPLHFRKQSTDP